MKLLSLRQPLQFALHTNRRLASSFRADDIQVTLTSEPGVKPDDGHLTFGAHMSDHMLEIDYTSGQGWGQPHIRPLAPLNIHPAAKVLHYASELFEGMKGYRCVDGKIRLFRPMENMARMAKTAFRTGLPEFDQAELTKCIKRLVSIDQEWVPYSDRCSLYIRPTFIGTEPSLGVTKSSTAKLFVITCPVGPYFPTGMKAVRLLADPSFVRAWPGGCGSFKMGSNYGPTVYIQDLAVKEHDCQQVLWLYGEDRQMTEVGTMNLFIYWINEQGVEELVTPPLDSGLILPGVTRKSLLDVAREWNEFQVSEKTVTMKQFTKALNENRVKEVFGAGTACVVCPVRQIVYEGQELTITNSEGSGELTQRFYDEINAIHYYRKPHPWMECIDKDVSEPLRKAEAN